MIADNDVDARLLLINMADPITRQVVFAATAARIGAIGAEQIAEPIATITRDEPARIGNRERLVIVVVVNLGDAT